MSKAIQLERNETIESVEQHLLDLRAATGSVELRLPSDIPEQEPPLRQHPLHRKVLDVGIFYRFNDAALQAAVLRAAAPGELDYSFANTETESANARLLLVRIFREPTAPATEFALALATGRLRLTEKDRKQVLAELPNLQQGLGAMTMAFLNAWKSH